MAILEYNLRAVGEADVARSLASVERRFVQHAARINRTLAMGGGTIRQRAASASPERVIQTATRVTKTVLTQEQRARIALDAEKRRSDLSFHRQAVRHDVAAHRQRLRHIEREKSQEITKLKAVNQAEKRERESARKSFRTAIGGGAVSGIGALTSVGKAGAGMIGVGGSVLAAAAVTEQLRLDERIRRFVVAGRDTGTAGQDPEQIRKRVMGLAMSTGIAPEAVMAGAQQFQTTTGRGDIGMDMAGTFATFAQATGGDPAEIAAAAASIFQNLKIEDINSLTEALAKLTFQGKKGSFEFADLASQLPRVTAALAGRGIGGGADGVAKMGAALQIIQTGTGDAAVTSTAFDAVLRQSVAKAKDIQSGAAFGGGKANIFEGGDSKKSMRGDFDVMLADILKASGGDAIKLQKIFGDEGMKGLNPFVAEFRRKGGGDTGHKAVVDMFKQFTEVGGNYTEIQRDAADVQKSTSVQFEIAMMELKQVFSEELMPVIREMVPDLKKLGPPFRVLTQNALELASALMNNPVAGIGAVLAAGIATELAKAQLAQAVTTGIVSPLGVAGLAVTAAAGAFVAAKLYVEGIFAQAEGRVQEAAARGDEVRAKALDERLTTGTISPETRKQLEALHAVEQRTIAGGLEAQNEGLLGVAGRGWNELFGGERNMSQGAALMGAASSEDYRMGASETKRLLAMPDKPQQQIEGGKQLLEAAGAMKEAASELKRSGVHRGNGPSPVKG